MGLTSCEYFDHEVEGVITFDDISLDKTTGYWDGSDLSGYKHTYKVYGMDVTEYSGVFKSGDLLCSNIYNDTYKSWSGMALSSKTNMDSIGYGNQFSVYSLSGAGGSSNFAVICPYDTSYCAFTNPSEVTSLMVNNSTYTYWAIKEGKDGSGYARKFTSGDYFYITITGFDTNLKKTGSVNYYLADFRDGKSYICQDWTKVSLTELGKSVTYIAFTLTSSDTSTSGMNTPGYVCIDNIAYKR